MAHSRAARAAYRQLLRSAEMVSVDCELLPLGGLVEYIRRRFKKVAAANRTALAKGSKIRTQIKMIDVYCAALQQAPDSAPLQSMLRAIASGVGSIHYQREIEEGFLSYASFEIEREKRQETDAQSTGDRQNRVMLHALLQYAEKLSILHEDLPSNELTNKLSSQKASVRLTCLSHNTEEIVVEIDEDLAKQTIFIKCQPYDFELPVEKVDVTEPTEMRGVVMHAAWFRIARRLFDTIVEETPVHKSRSTTIVGHGIGGAVAVAVAFLMSSVSYEMRNVVTFGAPKVVEACLERQIFDLSPIRIVSVGDPVVALPSTGSESNFFQHIGEILLLEPPVGETVDTISLAPVFSMRHYFDLMKNPDVRLSYAEGDEIWEASPVNYLGT